MFDFLYRWSDLHIFLFLSGIILSLSLILILVLKNFILHKLRHRDNSVVGSVAALIGVIYGILVGLMALYLLNNNDSASTAADKEGSMISNLYRASRGLQNPARASVQANIQNYIHHVIDVEWPLMEKNKKVDFEGDFIIEKIADVLHHYPIKNSTDSLLITEMLSDITNLYTAREQRIQLSQTSLDPDIWEVILISTIVIIGINYLYRVNFYLHMISVCAFSIIASCMIFLLVTLDRPFQGEFIIEPDALSAALAYIEDSIKKDSGVATPALNESNQ